MKGVLTAMQPKLEEGLVILGLALTEAQVAQLLEYANRILKWNQVYNLTAITKPEDVITHHLLDCLAVVPHFQKLLANCDSVVRILDVGAGAGLPGIVLAICQPSWQITMVDTVQKKAAFIQQTCAGLKLSNAKAEHIRIENFGAEQPYDVITSRAFASLDLFISLSHHLLAEQGHFAALKGRLEVDNEVPQGWVLDSVSRIEVPFLPEERHLFLIRR